MSAHLSGWRITVWVAAEVVDLELQQKTHTTHNIWGIFLFLKSGFWIYIPSTPFSKALLNTSRGEVGPSARYVFGRSDIVLTPSLILLRSGFSRARAALGKALLVAVSWNAHTQTQRQKALLFGSAYDFFVWLLFNFLFLFKRILQKSWPIRTRRRHRLPVSHVRGHFRKLRLLCKHSAVLA